MNCSKCGIALEPNEMICHRCGTPTPRYYASAGASPDEGTVIAPPLLQKPTGIQPPYNSQFGTFPQDMYNSPPPPPPPAYVPQGQNINDGYLRSRTIAERPQWRRNGKKIGSVVGVSMLLALLIGGVVFALMPKNTSNSNQSSNTTNPTQNQSSQNPYEPFMGTLVLNDTLHDNSRGYKWDVISNAGQNFCGFSNGAYHVTQLKTGGIVCVPEAQGLTLNNFTFEAKITIVQGDNGGIAFRINQKNVTLYYFSVNTNGSYILKILYTNGAKTLLQGTSPDIKQGLKQSNVLAVVANGSKFVLYVNNQKLNSINDTTYSTGQFGVLTFYDNGPSDVVVSDARIWKM